jgi:hypothetical protein
LIEKIKVLDVAGYDWPAELPALPDPLPPGLYFQVMQPPTMEPRDAGLL